jgi:hypothetical protein
VARKGFGLSPKDDKSGLGCGKEDGCGLSSTVDRSGVWPKNNPISYKICFMA